MNKKKKVFECIDEFVRTFTDLLDKYGDTTVGSVISHLALKDQKFFELLSTSFVYTLVNHPDYDFAFSVFKQLYYDGIRRLDKEDRYSVLDVNLLPKDGSDGECDARVHGPRDRDSIFNVLSVLMQIPEYWAAVHTLLKKEEGKDPALKIPHSKIKS